MLKPVSMGLVLTGGGARAAYQIGVLKAISAMMPDLKHPFRVICGTSAGAINAVGLASGDAIFRHNISRLEQLWTHLKVGDIYRSDTFGMTRWFSHFVQSIVRGQNDEMPASLLDSRPLRGFLEKEVKIDMIAKNIQEGWLDAIGVNVCGYTSGQSICFFQGRPDLPAWNLGQRLGVRCDMQVDHLMASSAIPSIFPPVRINREFFGDGATRQMAHISPALHLGADRILVIGVSANRICAPTRRQVQSTPTIAQVMEHMLNGLFLDTLEYDIDRLLLINQLLELIPQETLQAAGLNLRPVRLLDISPSEPLDELAAKHSGALPAMLRRLIGKGFENGMGGASLASYLLFDKAFCKDLIALGYADAQAHAKQLSDFFTVEDAHTEARSAS